MWDSSARRCSSDGGSLLRKIRLQHSAIARAMQNAGPSPCDGYNRPGPMRILLSNDDGYFAPGLERLAAVLSQRAEVTVVAPQTDLSGASNSLTLDRPLTVRRAPNGFLLD